MRKGKGKVVGAGAWGTYTRVSNWTALQIESKGSQPRDIAQLPKRACGVILECVAFDAERADCRVALQQCHHF